jgi:predicted dehydrogenase
MKLIKIGLIGCGTITIKAHIPALMNDPTAKLSGYNFVIKAICGLEPTTMEYIKSILPQVEVFHEYQDLIANCDCDAVLIATGEENHPVISKAALDKGLFVLCEKPFAENDTIIKNFIHTISPQQKNRIQIGFNKRFYPSYLEYERLREQNILGEPLTGSFSFVTQQGRKPGWDGILSNLIHYCDLICAIFGTITDISAKVSSNEESGISVTACMLSEKGASISLLFTSAGSWNAAFHEEWQLIDNQRKRIVCRNGRETYFFDGSPDHHHWAASNSIFWLPDNYGYKTQLRAFYELCCGEKKEPEPSIDDALKAHIMFDEIRKQCEKK